MHYIGSQSVKWYTVCKTPFNFCSRNGGQNSRSSSTFLVQTAFTWLSKQTLLLYVRLQSSPFFLSQPANDAGAREATDVRGRVGLEKREGRGKKTFPPFSPVPRGRASHTSRLPRVIRWLGEKKGTALQSNCMLTTLTAIYTQRHWTQGMYNSWPVLNTF